jgi:HEAT repeat protein
MGGRAPVPFGVFTVDTALVIRTWPAWLALVTGIDRADALGRSLPDLVPDLQARGLLAALERVLAGGTVEVLAPALHHYLIACPPSTPSAIFDRMQQRVTIGPIHENGRVTGAVVTIEDVTSRMERERDLARRLTRPGTHATGWRDEEAGAVATLTRALAADDPEVRRAAVTGLAAHGTAIVHTLIETLRDQHGNLNVLSSVLSLLELSDIDVIDPLVACLDDPDTNLRIQAALILGQRRDARATPALVRRLDDEDANVRFHAIEALGHLRAVEATGALMAVAERGDFFLAFPAIQTLAQLGDPDVAPRLVPLLGDELLRESAIEALGVLGDETVVPPLVDLIEHTGASAEVIADALASVYDRLDARYGAGERVADLVRQSISAAGTQHLLDAVPRVSGERLRGLARVLGWLDGPAVQRALTRLLSDASVRGRVVEALVRYGAGVVDLLVDQLDAEDFDTRRAAVAALGRIGDVRATPRLVAALADRDLALPAADALARIGASEAFEPLLALVGDDDVAIRQAAIGALHSIGHPEMPARVVRLLDDPRAVVRESAVRMAGYFGYPECLDAVLSHGRDDSDAVRRAIAEHLPFFEDPRATEAVLSMAASDPSPRVRAAAAAALGHLDEAVARPTLLGTLADADPWVRYFAVRTAASWRSPALAPYLLERLEHDLAGHVRLAAIDALGAIEVPEALPVLATLTADDDPDVAGAAIRALGRYRVPAAVEVVDRVARAREPWRRHQAVTALAARADDAATSTLQWVAAADDDADVARAAVRALVKVAEREAAPAAIRALLDLLGEPDRGAAAVEMLATIDPRHARIVAQGLHHPAPFVRRQTIDVLGRLRHPEASAAIVGALDDGDAGVRVAAIDELRHLGTTGGARKLLALAQHDPDPNVRQAALRAVAGTGRSRRGTDRS